MKHWQGTRTVTPYIQLLQDSSPQIQKGWKTMSQKEDNEVLS